MLCRGTACHKFLEPGRLLRGSYFRAISTNHSKGQAGGQGGEGLYGGGRKMKELIKGSRSRTRKGLTMNVHRDAGGLRKVAKGGAALG